MKTGYEKLQIKEVTLDIPSVPDDILRKDYKQKVLMFD